MHATSVYIARKQFIRHQPVVCTLARSEDFCIRVVCALLHTRVFVKFKSSCTVHASVKFKSSTIVPFNDCKTTQENPQKCKINLKCALGMFL